MVKGRMDLLELLRKGGMDVDTLLVANSDDGHAGRPCLGR